SQNNFLIGVKARAADDVWAVGSYENGGGVDGVTIVHWDGSAWTVSPTPHLPGYMTRLMSVTAVAANRAWAVGYYLNAQSTLILQWDGSAWTQAPSPG